MPPYDFIIAGDGLAGLSLACHLVHSPLRDRRILIVDMDPQKSNDRTWGYWSERPLLFDEAVYHTWDHLQIAGAGGGRTLPLGRYRYHVIRGIVDSLLLYGHPFDVPEDPDFYDLLDAVRLQVMQEQGEQVKGAFTAMFQRNRVEHILRFSTKAPRPGRTCCLSPPCRRSSSSTRRYPF
ncbi:MAG: lycopene cyclase family protein [Anaerolineae bacterium]